MLRFMRLPKNALHRGCAGGLALSGINKVRL